MISRRMRARRGRNNCRILYFFHGRNIAVLANATTKENEVPVLEIERAIERKHMFEKNPDRYGCDEDV